MTILATTEQTAALEWLRDRGLSPLQGFMMMREALEFYASDRCGYDILDDSGDKARAALEEK